MYTTIKILLTALIIVGSSELAKRWSVASTLLLALPFTSLLAIFWIYIESKDVAKISQLSWGIFWLVPPSLVFFPALSVSLDRGVPFYLAVILSIIIAVLTYLAYSKLLGLFGISI